MTLDPLLITFRVTKVLEDFKVRYFIAGSLASTVHGMVRTTQDPDLVADLRPEHAEHLVRELRGDFYTDSEMVSKAIEQRSSFNMVHRESFFKVDVFIPKLRPFIEEQFVHSNRQVLSLDPKIELEVATAEDTILAKLEWYRLGGEVSESQWRDVIGVIKVQASALDMEYLYRMAEEIEVTDLLNKALVEA